MNQTNLIRSICLSVLLSTLSMSCQAWVSTQQLVVHPLHTNPSSLSSRHPIRSSTGKESIVMFSDASSSGSVGVQSIDLAGGKMNDNHDEEGQLMANSVIAWLDSEWIPQEVHVQMANSAKKSYIDCRESNTSDVMDIMMQISNDLDENWAKYNDDAFINAWDIGNYCSDYLIKKSGYEGCDCSPEIL